ncbi:hypothetical protein F7725_020487 [Dissostichus mawsoni]|uniref:Ig-like domain-containing protein n=1 Tax=Dissostichus mawsoni TaxID=36200 RepID=A0A7J5YFD1_DISMA|nr:hypothetical protein F7725_020487 [Dissostichus mawsoni]
MTCRVDYNDNTSLQWSNPAQQTLFFGDKKALRDNRIELIRASSQELTIKVGDVSLSDDGLYTCSLFTMPVKTTKAFLTVLGVPSRPEITGFTKPAMEGDIITLTCSTLGSKPAANIRWFRNDKEVQGSKELNATGKSFTVWSSLQFQVDKGEDGVAYTCSVEHVSLSNPYMTTEVLEVHYAPRLEISKPKIDPLEGQYFKLECVSIGNPIPEPVLWSKDGGELPDIERMIVEGRELTITTLNKTDNGTYRCEASNHLGTSTAEYKLFVYVLLLLHAQGFAAHCVLTQIGLVFITNTQSQQRARTRQKRNILQNFCLFTFSSISLCLVSDPNALGQHGPDHALIGGVVAVVVFITLCLIIVLGRYLARHKGTYLTHEAKGAEDAPDADTAIINAEGNHVHAEEKKEYFI